MKHQSADEPNHDEERSWVLFQVIEDLVIVQEVFVQNECTQDHLAYPHDHHMAEVLRFVSDELLLIVVGTSVLNQEVTFEV